MDLGDYFHLDPVARSIVRSQAAKRKGLQLWRCPRCLEEVETLALDVAHRCSINRNRMTAWEQVPSE